MSLVWCMMPRWCTDLFVSGVGPLPSLFGDILLEQGEWRVCESVWKIIAVIISLS